jgi:TolB protein
MVAPKAIVRTLGALAFDRFTTGLAVLVVALAAFAATPARAEITIDVTGGAVEPLPIAIPDFVGSGETAQLGRDIAGVVAADLSRSGLFVTLDPASFIDRVDNPNVMPNFQNWRVINAQALVTGAITRAATAGCRPTSACGTSSPASS